MPDYFKRDEQRAFIASEEIASILLFMWRENPSAKCRTKKGTTPLASELRLFGCRKKTQGRFAMARVIEFYIPPRFRKQVTWIPLPQRGKVVEFRPTISKSA
jgi:hypothetical protein